MSKCNTIKLTFSKFLNNYKKQQYQEWRHQNFMQWAELTFQPYVFASFLFILFKLTFTAQTIIEWVLFAISIFFHILMFISIPILVNKQSKLLQLVPLIQQQCLTYVCICVQKDSYLIFYSSICMYFVSLNMDFRYKLLAIILFLVESGIFFNLESIEGIILTAFLLLLETISKEILTISNFLNLQALFMIIDSIPQAMCIVHKNKNWLLHSNKVFENLALQLDCPNSSETDQQSPDKNSTKNFAQNQLTFLQNLQLDELNQQGQINFEQELDDLQFEDQWRIKNVIFSKQQSQFTSLKTMAIETQIPSKNYLKQQKFFSFFKDNDNEQIIKKTYSSDVSLKIEIKSEPFAAMQSAQKKKRKYTDNYKNLILQPPSISPTRRKISADQLLSRESNYRSFGQKASLLDETPRNVTQTITHKKKFLIHVMENCRLFDAEDDMQIYFIQDITQILLNTKIKKLESIKRNLLRSISHELLTNMNAVFGYIKQGQDTVLKGESCIKQLELALRYTKLQQYKIYDFFDYRDILDDRFEIKQDKFGINTVIWECVDLFQDQIERKKLSINVDLPEISYIIVGDRQRLCQVLLNLIGNAIRFTQKGGVNIKVQNIQVIQSMQGIDVNNSCSCDEEIVNSILEIKIEDSGYGMNEDELNTLIKKLEGRDQDEKVSKQSVGIGLGLSVSKSIIGKLSQTNRNNLYVTSEKDVGTKFHFYLKYDDEKLFTSNLQKSNQQQVVPVDIQSTQQVRVMNYKQNPSLYITQKLGQSDRLIELPQSCLCKNILIVDDEQFNIDILSHLVKQLGYCSEYAHNGKEAIEKVSQKLENKCSQFCIGYFCVLMDINMPIMNGWEAVQRIRQMENEIQLTKTIPVIAVTAFCSISEQQKSINEGFNFVINKPATKENLLDAFSKLNI